MPIGSGSHSVDSVFPVKPDLPHFADMALMLNHPAAQKWNMTIVIPHWRRHQA
jgi:hypothetical protein